MHRSISAFMCLEDFFILHKVCHDQHRSLRSAKNMFYRQFQKRCFYMEVLECSQVIQISERKKWKNVLVSSCVSAGPLVIKELLPKSMCLWVNFYSCVLVIHIFLFYIFFLSDYFKLKWVRKGHVLTQFDESLYCSQDRNDETKSCPRPERFKTKT